MGLFTWLFGSNEPSYKFWSEAKKVFSGIWFSTRGKCDITNGDFSKITRYARALGNEYGKQWNNLVLLAMCSTINDYGGNADAKALNAWGVLITYQLRGFLESSFVQYISFLEEGWQRCSNIDAEMDKALSMIVG